MLNQTVGNNIRKIREQKNYSQEAVESALDIAHTTYARIETGVGKIDMDRLEKLAEFFGMQIEDIIFYNDVRSYKTAPPPELIEEKNNTELIKCQEKNKALAEKVEMLEEKVNDKETIIKLLTGELWNDAAKAAKKLRDSKKNK